MSPGLRLRFWQAINRRSMKGLGIPDTKLAMVTKGNELDNWSHGQHPTHHGDLCLEWPVARALRLRKQPDRVLPSGKGVWDLPDGLVVVIAPFCCDRKPCAFGNKENPTS